MLPLHLVRGRCLVVEYIMSIDVVVADVEVTVEDVQRILELGSILRSVLSKEELMELENIFHQTADEIGNTSVS
jgi:hypothetical protein